MSVGFKAGNDGVVRELSGPVGSRVPSRFHLNASKVPYAARRHEASTWRVRDRRRGTGPNLIGTVGGLSCSALPLATPDCCGNRFHFLFYHHQLRITCLGRMNAHGSFGFTSQQQTVLIMGGCSKGHLGPSLGAWWWDSFCNAAPCSACLGIQGKWDCMQISAISDSSPH